MSREGLVERASRFAVSEERETGGEAAGRHTERQGQIWTAGRRNWINLAGLESESLVGGLCRAKPHSVLCATAGEGATCLHLMPRQADQQPQGCAAVGSIRTV
jgi:hypothetical protein